MVSLMLVSDRSMNLRVGMIVLFTSLFALVVGLLTNARRAVKMPAMSPSVRHRELFCAIRKVTYRKKIKRLSGAFQNLPCTTTIIRSQMDFGNNPPIQKRLSSFVTDQID